MKVVLGGQISLGNFVRGGHYFQGDNKNCDTGIVFFLLDWSYAIYSDAQSIEGVRGPLVRSCPKNIHTLGISLQPGRVALHATLSSVN